MVQFRRESLQLEIQAKSHPPPTHDGAIIFAFFRRYMKIPPVSRIYLTSAFLTTAACSVDIVSPLTLYFNYHLVFHQGQFWRLITPYLFFGVFSIDFMFHMYFLVSVSTLLFGWCMPTCILILRLLDCRIVGSIQPAVGRGRFSWKNGKLCLDASFWDHYDFRASFVQH